MYGPLHAIGPVSPLTDPPRAPKVVAFLLSLSGDASPLAGDFQIA